MSQSSSNDELCIRVCQACVGHLSDRFVYEKGLFRTLASMTDIRVLKRQLMMDSNMTSRIKSESDPHIVVGVIQSCLKEMSVCLLNEVYEDIMRIDVSDSIENNIANVASWIVQLPPLKFELVRNLCSLLLRIASLGGNETVLQLLTQNIAPHICRPLGTAFLSIRHQSDLKRSRLVVSFIIENVNLIFTKDLKPRPQPAQTVSTATSTTPKSGSGKRGGSNLRLLDIAIDDSSSGYPYDEYDSGNVDRFGPGNNGFGQNDIIENIVNGGPGANSGPPAINTHSWEWNVLEALTMSHVDFFLRPREVLSGRFTSADLSNSGKDSTSAGGSQSAQVAAATGALGRPGTPATGLWSRGGSSPSNSPAGTQSPSSSSSGNSTANNARIMRRKLVAEVKALRAEITKFEEEYTKKHNRAPKANERGAMAEAYERYRSLKRGVRDQAAKSIQRLIRGFITRRRLRSQRTRLHAALVTKGSTPTSNSSDSTLIFSPSPISSSSGGSSSSLPGKRKGIETVGSGTSSSATRPSSAPDGSTNPEDRQGMSVKVPADIFAKYKDLWGQKHELKRRLKKYDDDFAAQHKRQPTKAEKEVMRPMYDKYHEVKATLDSLKAEIEASNEPIPEYLVPLLGVSDKLRRSGMTTTDDGVGLTGEADEDAAGRPGSSDAASSALVEEKKGLHAYLKDYEREFTRTHGRPVMRQEDIEPVAQEYRRYKELKTLTAKR